MDAEGNVIHQQRARTVAAFQASAAALPVLKDLEKRIAAGEKGLDYDLLMARWDLGQVGYEEIKEIAEGLEDLTEEQQARLAAVMVDAEVDHLVGTTRVRDEAQREAALRRAGPRLKEILTSDHPLSEDRQGTAWSTMLAYAELEGDADLFAKAVAWHRAAYADEPRAERFLASLEARLEKLRKGD